jgi:glycosyltransferase involved in cell wall biosynthesis
MDSVCSALMTAGIRVVRETLLGLAARPLRVIGALSDWGQISRLRRMYRGIGPDIVHVNQQYDEDGLDYMLAAKLSGLPVVGTIHLPMCSNKHLRPLGRIRTIAMRRWYAACRYRRIFVSTAAMNEFVALYGGAELGKAIANGVRLRGASAGEVAGLPQGWTRGDPVVGFFGRLDTQKDPLLLANAWLVTREQLPNCRLVFVGDGPLRGDLETWARRVGAEDSVHITGWLSDPSSWWALVDVFAMTSVFEGMSLALLEAIHHGKRIVVTECGGVKQVAAKAPWMRVVADRRPSVVASSLEAVIAEGPPDEADTRGAREYFSTSRMAEETLDVYVKAREDGRSGRRNLV